MHKSFGMPSSSRAANQRLPLHRYARPKRVPTFSGATTRTGVTEGEPTATKSPKTEDKPSPRRMPLGGPGPDPGQPCWRLECRLSDVRPMHETVRHRYSPMTSTLATCASKTRCGWPSLSRVLSGEA